MINKAKMNTNKLLVSFVAIASVLFLVATVSAVTSTGTLVDNTKVLNVEVDGITVEGNTVSVIAGEKVLVKVEFDSAVDDSDVTVEIELEGEKVSTDAISKPFDVETGSRYSKVLVLSIPYELKDAVSDDLTLIIQVDGKSYKSDLADITLKVQRPSYNAEIKSISVSQTAEAGETIPVDVVLKNMGYNNLDDVYVRAKIVELGVEQTSYFGDLVKLENDTSDNDKDVDTVSGRIYLKIPYDVKAGSYTVEITVKNDDTESRALKTIVIENDFANSVIVTSSSKTVAAGKTAEYDLLIVNPTNKLKVYKVVTESSADLSSSTESAVIAIPAGSSKAVKVTATSNTEGAYTFNVNVFSGDKVVDTAALSLNVEGKTTATNNPIVILTIVLAVIFLVLLVVLVVLLGKKPSQTEDLGESYY